MTPMDAQTRLERLLVLRSRQESLLESEVPAREAAALSREYRATLAEIEQLEPATHEGDDIDEIADRRAARRSSAANGATRTKRSG